MLIHACRSLTITDLVSPPGVTKTKHVVLDAAVLVVMCVFSLIVLVAVTCRTDITWFWTSLIQSAYGSSTHTTFLASMETPSYSPRDTERCDVATDNDSTRRREHHRSPRATDRRTDSHSDVLHHKLSSPDESSLQCNRQRQLADTYIYKLMVKGLQKIFPGSRCT